MYLSIRRALALAAVVARSGLNPKAPAWKTVFASIQSIVGTK
jgi:hypothetical protein